MKAELILANWINDRKCQLSCLCLWWEAYLFVKLTCSVVTLACWVAILRDKSPVISANWTSTMLYHDCSLDKWSIESLLIHVLRGKQVKQSSLTNFDVTVPLKSKLPPSRETSLVSLKTHLGSALEVLILCKRGCCLRKFLRSPSGSYLLNLRAPATF